ncbi:hypothetical protein BaRGS_00033470, partial [Batillaria attramentaria]
DYFVRRAVKNLINMNNHRVLDTLRSDHGTLFAEEPLQRSYSDMNLRHQIITDDILIEMAEAAADKLGWETEVFLRRLGQEYFKLCLGEYGKALRVLGSNLMEFFSNLDGLHEHIRSSPRFQGQTPPSFRCDVETSPKDGSGSVLNIHYYSFRRDILPFVGGTVEAVANMLFNTNVTLVVSPNRDRTSPHQMFFITTPPSNNNEQMCKLCFDQGSASKNPSDSKLSVRTFCSSFPFHVIFDRNLHVTQLGTALMKLVTAERVAAEGGLPLRCLFEVVRPMVKMSFQAFLSRLNSSFTLRTKPMINADTKNGRFTQEMDLKGQMIYLQETDAMLFLGSPSVEKLDELIGKGIYISDIPIHDATRDVILVGEQTKAQRKFSQECSGLRHSSKLFRIQPPLSFSRDRTRAITVSRGLNSRNRKPRRRREGDGLKKRMELLKKSILEASKAVEEEKAKNIELLHEIFPPSIATKLWKGESVEPMKVDDVSMLFSDIVGFTAICSTATPMQVVNMLNSLYTGFDTFCVQLDVYKIETIGDAYCVAGGLHRKSRYHAQQIAWMAMRMMSAARNEKSHDGNTIKMRIGIHTGSVLAGVVGSKMPRYCLFGNNVTLANKFESGSEPLRTHISPTTYKLLQPTPGFKYEPRSRESLPAGFPDTIEGISYFLDDYVHPGVPENERDTADHIARAVEDFKIHSSHNST